MKLLVRKPPDVRFKLLVGSDGLSGTGLLRRGNELVGTLGFTDNGLRVRVMLFAFSCGLVESPPDVRRMLLTGSLGLVGKLSFERDMLPDILAKRPCSSRLTLLSSNLTAFFLPPTWM